LIPPDGLGSRGIDALKGQKSHEKVAGEGLDVMTGKGGKTCGKFQEVGSPRVIFDSGDDLFDNLQVINLQGANDLGQVGKWKVGKVLDCCGKKGQAVEEQDGALVHQGHDHKIDKMRQGVIPMVLVPQKHGQEMVTGMIE
jgi:hypothetical protein